MRIGLPFLRFLLVIHSVSLFSFCDSGKMVGHHDEPIHGQSIIGSWRLCNGEDTLHFFDSGEFMDVKPNPERLPDTTYGKFEFSTDHILHLGWDLSSDEEYSHVLFDEWRELSIRNDTLEFFKRGRLYHGISMDIYGYWESNDWIDKSKPVKPMYQVIESRQFIRINHDRTYVEGGEITLDSMGTPIVIADSASGTFNIDSTSGLATIRDRTLQRIDGGLFIYRVAHHCYVR